MTKGNHRRNSSSSSSSSCDSSEGSRCVGGYCDNGCGPCPPAQIYEPEVLSSVGCYTSCAPPLGRKLCESTSELTCPPVEHCAVVKKPKKEKKCEKKQGCGKCGYKKCHCDESYEWSKILCQRDCSSSSESSESSSSDSCVCGKMNCRGECGVIVPNPGCGYGQRVDYDDSTSTSDCPKKKKGKKAKKVKEPPCDKKPKPKPKPKPAPKPPVLDSSKDESKMESKMESKAESKECEKCCYPNESCKCGNGGKAKGKSFTVRMGSKVGHPNEHRIKGNQALLINGKQVQMLHFNVDRYYLFDVDLDGDAKVFFTTDIMGGNDPAYAFPPSWKPSVLEGAPNPIGKGTICLKVTSSMPKTFYLQSDSVAFAGCMCVLHSSS